MKIRFSKIIVTVCLLFVVGATSLAQKGEVRPSSLKLNGLYRGFAFVPQFGAAVGEAYVFSATGNVYKGWPGTQLPDRFDFTRAKSRQPGNTGRYVISGDKISFFWSNKTRETASFSFRRDAKTGKTNLVIGTFHCFKLGVWNKPIEGTFDPSTYQGGFSDSQSQPPALVERITFSRAGGFTVTGDDSRPISKGRYKVKGAALTFITADKKERTHSLHVFEDRKQPLASLLIDGRPFLVKAK